LAQHEFASNQTGIDAHRVLSVALVMLTALPWSLALGVLGLWMIAEPQAVFVGGGRAMTTVSISAGIAAICAAQVIFLLCIADRVFPGANQRMVRVIEGGLGVIFLCSAGVLAVASFIGWYQGL